MKKVLFVFAIAASLVACNNSADTSATASADSARIADSIAAATPAMMDTAAAKIDTAAAMIDSAAAKLDSAIKK